MHFTAFVWNKYTQTTPLLSNLVFYFPVWAIKREINKIISVWRMNEQIIENVWDIVTLNSIKEYLWYLHEYSSN